MLLMVGLGFTFRVFFCLCAFGWGLEYLSLWFVVCMSLPALRVRVLGWLHLFVVLACDGLTVVANIQC